MDYRIENGKIIIELPERIDGTVSVKTEQELSRIIDGHRELNPVLAADKLNYISSAGLRVLLKLKKTFGKEIIVQDVSPEIYEIFSTTGFDVILDVRKRLREISVEGCEIIGKGGNGIVYRLDTETIVKVYYGDRNDIEKIRSNQTVTKNVFIHEIPSAIAFDMVKVGDSYGIVYEMIDARSMLQEMIANPDKLEHYAEMIADTLKKLHRTEFEKGTLPDARDYFRKDIQTIADAGYLNPKETEKLNRLIDDIPERNTFIHHDFHPGNIMLQKGEIILIDVEDAGLGHPVMDLSSMYLVYVTAAKSNWGKKEIPLGKKEFAKIWDIFIKRYFETTDKKEIAEINRILNGYSRIKMLHGVVSSPRVPDILKKTASPMIKRKLMASIDSLHPIP